VATTDLKAPWVAKKVYLLKEFIKDKNRRAIDFDIKDPIGRPIEVYRYTKAEIKEAIDKVAQKL